VVDLFTKNSDATAIENFDNMYFSGTSFYDLL